MNLDDVGFSSFIMFLYVFICIIQGGDVQHLCCSHLFGEITREARLSKGILGLRVETIRFQSDIFLVLTTMIDFRCFLFPFFETKKKTLNLCIIYIYKDIHT